MIYRLIEWVEWVECSPMVCVIPKILKIVVDASFLNAQQYKARINAKVEQSRERSGALPYTSV